MNRSPRRRLVSGPTAGDPGQRGSSLLEVLVALLILALSVLAAAPAFVLSMQQNAGSADTGRVDSAAASKLEQLRSSPYHDLIPGGSVVMDQTGFFENPGNGITVRWQILDGGGPAGARTVLVSATADRGLMGPPRSVLLSMLRAR